MNIAKKAALAVAVAGIATGVSAGAAVADAGATGSTSGSGGILSGNVVQVPIHAPVNVVGTTLNVVGVGNPASDNSGSNS
ncbi:chaplin [Streptomyces jeddahensis]|uniref:Chaplin domain-containing protein n=1 Tax=Streptomyces jeddahensis TaxID=1716141 RepID=A0A177HIK5_9ACTN|nr:chaplin [Streptomyces jeddahensis]OAH10556.1 hypothetical protein STSP_61170 [Streptomyces jeddahensis]